MFKHILLPVDITDTQNAGKALEAAVDLAQRHQAELHLFSVIPGFGSPMVAGHFPKHDVQALLNEIYRELEQFAKASVPEGIKTRTRVVDGTPHKEILIEAERVHADLIVMPSHDQKAVERFFLGSVAARVVERAHVSVMVIRP
ncbi:hypothetical protein BFW38_07375 [Terasakiispira papahanaumokuakeensis]|uniref:UspA domain-containing protein n=1 Tax=Terasakiispira papahanaumokuakeensis TaxID=197479 RepID=A0A1E2V8U0_9GAMM|nr:universal stress protein [Terasakiispira papahanaumokuakeensis]ODC03397.1 hypothetical protein BFW38_07375 [Terasakiispira papahanaumokuakeensis]